MLLLRLTIFIIFFSAGKLFAQTACTALGQNPSTAFPVCGTSVFQQDSVPMCSSVDLYVPGCSIYGDTNSAYQNKNPFWYKFTCFKSGTLSFVITPNQPDEDYDWQLYDVTGHNPDDVYTDTSLIVAGNWAGTYDSTGASSTGVNFIQCQSAPEILAPTFALSPNLVAGHNYLLLVSHFSDTQQGYSLSFGGGTAVITDTLPPHIAVAKNTTCDGSKILVKLNKRMKCSSLSANGSDFIISPPLTTIINAQGISCANGFDMDSVLLTFSSPLPFGNYNLIARNGTDGNTLLDLCDNDVPPGESIPFSVLSPQPVPMDSLNINQCSADSLILIFPDSIKCNSAAANGSDFFVMGSYPVSVSNATPLYCINGLTTKLVVKFTRNLLHPGSFNIILRNGTDGNTLLSKCDNATIAGSAIPFTIAHKPVADFSFTNSVCLPNASIIFNNTSTIGDGTQNSLSYLWNFADSASGINNTSILPSPTHIYNGAGPYSVSLHVTSNKGCSVDTIIPVNSIHPQPVANFGVSKYQICIGDELFFSDSSNSMDGITTQWHWNLGNAVLKDSSSFYYTYPVTQTYQASLYVINNHGCKSNPVAKQISVYPYPVANAGPDRTILEGGSIRIEATANGSALQYLWSPATYLNNTKILNPICKGVKDDIRYSLLVTSAGGCSSTDDMFIKVLKVPRIPNTFSPNNDGINDFWEIQFLEDYKENHTQVFTRAGQLVFESKGIYKPWNGTYKGKPLPIDTYYYIIEPGSGREPFTGYVTILK